VAAQQRRHRGVRREGRRPDGPLHVQAAGTLFLTALANQDGGDRTYAAFLPAHYLKRFHPEYTKKDDIDKLVQAAGFKTWTELFAAKNAPFENPERPTMGAWVPVTRVSDQVFTLRRNPYFVGVDPDGNQLPYLDEVRFTFFADIQALNLAAIAGEFDMQERHIQMTNYPVFKENEKSGKYRVITWPTVRRLRRGGRVQHVVQGRSGDRQALREQGLPGRALDAINRDQIKESVFSVSASRVRACRALAPVLPR
jgi:peptide/nickel transport system substrate-binding protein